jgi:hypothetical protein
MVEPLGAIPVIRKVREDIRGLDLELVVGDVLRVDELDLVDRLGWSRSTAQVSPSRFPRVTSRINQGNNWIGDDKGLGSTAMIEGSASHRRYNPLLDEWVLCSRDA